MKTKSILCLHNWIKTEKFSPILGSFRIVQEKKIVSPNLQGSPTSMLKMKLKIVREISNVFLCSKTHNLVTIMSINRSLAVKSPHAKRTEITDSLPCGLTLTMKWKWSWAKDDFKAHLLRANSWRKMYHWSFPWWSTRLHDSGCLFCGRLIYAEENLSHLPSPGDRENLFMYAPGGEDE